MICVSAQTPLGLSVATIHADVGSILSEDSQSSAEAAFVFCLTTDTPGSFSERSGILFSNNLLIELSCESRGGFGERSTTEACYSLKDEDPFRF